MPQYYRSVSLRTERHSCCLIVGQRPSSDCPGGYKRVDLNPVVEVVRIVHTVLPVRSPSPARGENAVQTVRISMLLFIMITLITKNIHIHLQIVLCWYLSLWFKLIKQGLTDCTVLWRDIQINMLYLWNWLITDSFGLV